MSSSTETANDRGGAARRRPAARPSVRLPRIDWVVLAVFAVVVVTMPTWLVWIAGYEALATKIAIWALFALGFDILLGFTGYLSFGHAAFFGAAAYFAGLSLKHLSADILPALALSLGGTLVIALILGFLTLRRSGIYFSVLTLAFAEMIHALVLSSTLQAWTGGDNGLTGLQSPSLFGSPLSEHAVFLLSAVLLILGFAVAMVIRRSPFGLMLRSIKENPMRLEYTGVNVFAYKLAGFVISAMYAGLAGALMVIYEPYVATKYLYWSTSGEVVIMSVIGGVGTLIGPMAGAAFMLYFENVVQAFIGEQWKLVLGIIFVGIVIFLPGGFADLGRQLWRATGHRIRARRHNVPDMSPAADSRPHRRLDRGDDEG
ncbi:branched-chain amino acid ABC transporter permease [Azospirillum sp. ST 5-10]|uniref:branched-chain amino acid ABC transporter permease n=1 Tax=unclassified Azospirillum TaxID=2630922 RepID=UPI003F4A6BA8